jgi:hypothetical protein
MLTWSVKSLPASIKRQFERVRVFLSLPRENNAKATERTNITRLFRNPPQLQLLSTLLPLSHKDIYRVVIYGVADGSEAVSLLIALDPARTGIQLEIYGFDICTEYLTYAGKFLFTKQHFPPNLKPEDFDNYLERDGKGDWRLKSQWQPFIRYSYANVLQRNDALMPAFYDLVMCQNVLIHLPQNDCDAAIGNLVSLVRSGGFLAIGGGPLGLVHHLVLKNGFTPILQHIEAIHESWTVQRQFHSNPHPPYWALEPFDAAHPDGVVRYCTLFRKPTNKEHTGYIGQCMI